MKKSIYIITTILFFLAANAQLSAQGCVAIRQFSTCNGNNLSSNLLSKGEWQLGMNYRYFKSFRHFRGTHEEPDRVANNTEVINHSHAWDFTVTYGVGKRLFASFTLPFVLNTRSSLYEHGRTERHYSFSRGVADSRFGLGYWLISPEKYSKGNISIGLGIKLPTGNYNASDIFYNVGVNGSPEVRPVDQSIQPGDGGFGATLDLQFYQQITGGLYVYGGGFYLFNPRDTNGIRTFRETLSPVLQNEAIMSVPDQYSFRAGFNYALSNAFGISAGVRYEGVPVEDLIGDSNGFRRPGTVLSVDPGISYMKNNISFSLSVPFAIKRNRPQSLTDLETEQMTGTPRNGDAAFADYMINVGIGYRFHKGGMGEMPGMPKWEGLKN
ncbi:MAG TPA: transporter [Saprospiraceae bacterium]|nr:transporter [Saprospiraceae bacterium]